VALKQAGGVAHGGKGAVLDNLLADAAVARVRQEVRNHFEALAIFHGVPFRFEQRRMD
jgi:hypothetical protein